MTGFEIAVLVFLGLFVGVPALVWLVVFVIWAITYWKISKNWKY
jgi:flagellar biosynthesis component FlhA